MTTTDVDLCELIERIGSIPDPEIPVLSIADLGVLRSVEARDGRFLVSITPTYSGCPAMHHIEQAVLEVLDSSKVDGGVELVFSPAWTTDWMSDVGRKKLREYGIAPPGPVETPLAIRPLVVLCPQCDSPRTEIINRFGSTACKSLRRCLDCLEPFDHFKEF